MSSFVIQLIKNGWCIVKYLLHLSLPIMNQKIHIIQLIRQQQFQIKKDLWDLSPQSTDHQTWNHYTKESVVSERHRNLNLNSANSSKISNLIALQNRENAIALYFPGRQMIQTDIFTCWIQSCHFQWHYRGNKKIFLGDCKRRTICAVACPPG